jgi:hypothetical protein
MAAPRLLAVYLQDHHAGSITGASLARRVAGENEGSAYGEELARIASEIERDQETLEQLMSALDVGTDRIKDSLAWAGEKAGRLKPNARLFDYSPLSRLLELDGLMLGVTAKLGLWRALERVAGEVGGLDGFDFPALQARAKGQLDRLDQLHLRAAAEALPND